MTTNVSIDARRKAVAAMIGTMKTAKPSGILDDTFTMGWDVVATYSMEKINGILKERHSDKATTMLKTLSWSNSVDGVSKTFNVNFGPPLLHFDANCVVQPTCSLTMEVLKDSTWQDGPNLVQDIDPGWTVTLNNIPLGSAMGKLDETGTIEGQPEIKPAADSVSLESLAVSESDKATGKPPVVTQNIVLGFTLNPKGVTATLELPPNAKAGSDSFQHLQHNFLAAVKNFFIGSEIQNTTKQDAAQSSKDKSLSYSIASINNAIDPEDPDLTPARFQFATLNGGPKLSDPLQATLSIFMNVKGCRGFQKPGNYAVTAQKPQPQDSGYEEPSILQQEWTVIWHKLKARPIPRYFGCSMILSRTLLLHCILKKAFDEKDWDYVGGFGQESQGTRFRALNRNRFKIDKYEDRYHQRSKFYIHELDMKMDKSPFDFKIEQSDPDASPTASVYWEHLYQVKWTASTSFGNSSGKIDAKWRLCDPIDFAKHRQVDAKFDVVDQQLDEGSETAIKGQGLAVEMNITGLPVRMDQGEENAIDYNTWVNGMSYLWSKAPKVDFKTISLGFFQTTNLLTPGRQVMKIDQSIGLRAPLDWVLVGDLLGGDQK